MSESTTQVEQLEARVTDLTWRLTRTQEILATLLEEWRDALAEVREREAQKAPRPRGRHLSIVP